MSPAPHRLPWANFLHVYQPADQQRDILEAVIQQSYRPIFERLKTDRGIRLTLNVTGALFEILDTYGHRDLIDCLRRAGKEGRIEFTGSAKYHAFLPFLEDDEIVRQIHLNTTTNRFYLGPSYRPRGFFPPEMAYKKELARIVAGEGFEWILLDEIACTGVPGEVDYTKIYRIKGTSLKAFFRERRLSNLIMSAVVRSSATLLESMREDLATKRYVVTAMDGETFGHHRPGLDRLLFEIFHTKQFKLVCMSDLLSMYPETLEIDPVRSTWASSERDILKGVQFLSWSDPDNILHRWQWKLQRLVLTEVQALPSSKPSHRRVRKQMDVALASDHFWWASAKPWWSLEMIEDGAFRLLDTIRMIPGVGKKKLDLALHYYEKIVSTAFDWQRTGKIRQMMAEQNEALRIPFKDRTVGRGGTERGVYAAFLHMMQDLERKAARGGEYEKAILWRDAVMKMEHKLDIYDAINVIDLLRLEIPHERVEKTIEKYKEQYRKIRGGQPEQRGS
ncbi:MAG: hypothetical protein V1778_01060 [bacterium]